MEISNLSSPARPNDLYVYGIQTVLIKSIEVGRAALYWPTFNLAYSALTILEGLVRLPRQVCVDGRGAGHLQDGSLNYVIFEIIKIKSTPMTDELLRVFKKEC